MDRSRTSGVLIAVLSAITIPYPLTAAADESVIEYTAEYEVLNGRRRIANAEFSVRRLAEDRYVFNSAARARGIYRLALPDPAIERSEFRFADGHVSPQSFRYEDGSRKGEDNYSVDFDGTAGEVRLSLAGSGETFPLEDDLLDRGSLQVALMQDLAACRSPGPYTYVDDDGIRTYHYERLEDLPTDTGIGMLDTVRFSQSREGSSRTTTIWLAPELSFLPVRIEQIRDGEIDTVFALDDVEGLEAKSCSGFR